MKKKVFISIPMNGRDVDCVRKEMAEVFQEFCDNDKENEYELIDQTLPDTGSRVDMLGRSIRLMSKADIVIFTTGWNTSKGCLVESYVCDLYGIPVFIAVKD